MKYLFYAMTTILDGVQGGQAQFWKRATKNESAFSNNGHLERRTALLVIILKGRQSRVITAKFCLSLHSISEDKI